MPVKTIQAWSDRQLLDEFETGSPGKNAPRLYSLANAIQLHGMYVAVNRGGLAVKTAVKVGRACVKRFVDRFDQGDRNFDEPFHPFVYGVDYEGKLKGVFMDPDVIADCLDKYGRLTSANLGSGLHAAMFDIDALNHALWNNYQEINENFNELALAGKLKPFPKYLE